MGLTLTAASTVVFGELSTPGDIVQAEDRAPGSARLAVLAFLHADPVDDGCGDVQNKLRTWGRCSTGTWATTWDYDDQTHTKQVAGRGQSPGGGVTNGQIPGLGEPGATGWRR